MCKGCVLKKIVYCTKYDVNYKTKRCWRCSVVPGALTRKYLYEMCLWAFDISWWQFFQWAFTLTPLGRIICLWDKWCQSQRKLEKRYHHCYLQLFMMFIFHKARIKLKTCFFLQTGFLICFNIDFQVPDRLRA